MPTLTPIQREAYEALRSLWEVRGIKRQRATQIFLDLLGYDEVPYFTELDVVECEQIIEALKSDNLLAALADAGRETGICQICGRELTDPDSIAKGIGPICAGKASAPASLAEFL